MSTHWWYRLKKVYELFPGGREPVSGTFLAAYYQRKQKARSLPRTLLDSAIGVGFKAWVPSRARRIQRKYKLSDDWRQSAIATAKSAFCDPNDIALFDADTPDRMGRHMRRFEHTAINRRINPRHWQPQCTLNDKIMFYQRCEELDLPHPVMRAYWRGGSLTPVSLPSGDSLILKPASGQGGAGVRKLNVPEDARTDMSAFEDWLAGVGRLQGDWVAQDIAVNHPSVEPISLQALSTARVSTVLNEAGEPEIVTSVMRFPADPEALVDNIKAGGLMAAIDVETGTLGPARYGRGVGGVTEWMDAHPQTGAEVTGRVLPDWDDVVALVKRVHLEGFPDYNLIGWDVALTPSGPVLLEGNGKPCIIVAQRANGLGIGETRFGELLTYHLERAERP